MTEINKLVRQLAQAYLAARGNVFTHQGIQLPLAAESLTMAIHNNIVGAHLENTGAHQGPADALLMLRHMVVNGTLTTQGALVVDQMYCAFCADAHQMQEGGKDPVVELASESKRRAMQ
ncbi:hypothetical protein M2R28_04140 [Aeromonas hydrophila]|uniref:hypothetical protein n=1 Tax=Aeromonas hydrophila TaxID=644 RepID=UPI0014559443|nr:hypothetical protein [Aeromonas hydrophila]MBW3830968.1 hypothetical protein [Aeromonas hydrophila]MBW5263115.1 hypothetical protein [Aeromonas hydrophila]MBW5277520.1 hypothetical protein [Aeromonas hydrophila]MCO4198876.1 hypothetical protein [Aeromonas hydrophila]NLR37358.1 hypothetical protein [Aeromonas hydrophila]